MLRTVMADLLGAFAYGIVTFVLLVLMASGGSANDPGAASPALVVSISETRDAILLHIHASGGVAPGSVEVRFAGRKTVVLARDAEGHAIRSQTLRLPEAVVEEGTSAGYEADGALLVMLRKEASAQKPRPPDDGEADAP